MSVGIELSDYHPSPESCIVLKIDFDSNFSSAARVFEIAAELIHSLEDMDRVLAHSIDAQLTTSLIVEDLQKSSVKVFLKNVISGVPDDGLKEVNFKKMIGPYLVKGKYALINWLDDDKNKQAELTDLTEKVAELARETDAKLLPDYPAPTPQKLAQPMDRFQEAKKKFTSSESLTITLGEEDYSVNTKSTWLPSESLKSDKEDEELVNEQEIYLIIGRPDFIGNARWSFQHGKNKMNLEISDKDWLRKFRDGEFPLKPGDALRVILRVENSYDVNGTLLDTTKIITSVLEVIKDSSTTGDLFGDA